MADYTTDVFTTTGRLNDQSGRYVPSLRTAGQYQSSLRSTNSALTRTEGAFNPHIPMMSRGPSRHYHTALHVPLDSAFTSVVYWVFLGLLSIGYKPTTCGRYLPGTVCILAPFRNI